ncbi:hypothetical protein AB833_02125 [Chromatiales bacterium (ex Bugula neritina AB1)]|nr:hypothetical protein AB833_02125 [Chromatiales bacterium (ex Bugula neritina AB1)]
MTDIEQWLSELGLAIYAAAFADNAIDTTLLSELDHDTLKEIGVKSLGHRLRILKAIASRAPEDAGNRAISTGNVRSDQEAERRHISVMFCDLVGSTQLSSQLDPEDLRYLLHQFQNVASATIKEHDGFIARYMGDGVLVYFGYPKAREDDAERAVRCGLALSLAIPGLKLSPQLHVRVGIATGSVVVGDIVGEGVSMESTVIGATPNLAARLQGLAKPDEVVVSQGTRNLLGSQFELEEMGMHPIRGFPTPLPVWRMVAERNIALRFDAARASRLTSFVGREHEVGEMTNYWQHCLNGVGHAALVSGEAGIGKSRLLENVCEQIRFDKHTLIQCQCSVHQQNTALYPIIRQLEQAAGIDSIASNDANLKMLETYLQPLVDETKIPLMASLLAMPVQTSAVLPPLSPQERQQIILATLCDIIVCQSQSKPVLLIFEDAHWSDPTSLEFLNLLLQKIAALPVFIIITHRPIFSPPWEADTHIHKIAIDRLTQSQCGNLINSLTKGCRLPVTLFHDILKKTDGVPLFLEELTKSILESDVLTKRGSQYQLDGPIDSLKIPSTLQASLMARLDRLGAGKDVAQLGAIIGREFEHNLLAEVSDFTPGALELGLEELIEAALVFQHTEGNRKVYNFKHALVQEIARDSLLNTKRQRLHHKVLDVLESNFSDYVDNHPEVLAYHADQAGQHKQAVKFWQRSGIAAMDRWANREAASDFKLALRALEQLPRNIEQQELEIDLHLKSRNALHPLGEYENTITHLLKAKPIAEQINDQHRLATICIYLCAEYRSVSDYDRAIANGRQALALDVGHNNFDVPVVANAYLGSVYYALGDYEQALQTTQWVLDTLDREHLHNYFGQITLPSVASRFIAALSLIELGKVKPGVKIIHEMIDIAESENEPYSRCLAYFAAGYVFSKIYRYNEAISVLEDGLRLCQKSRISHYYAMIAPLLAIIYAVNCNETEARNVLSQVDLEWQGAGLVRHTVVARSEALLHLGEYQNSKALATEALTAARKSKQQGAEVYALHVLAQVHRIDTAGDIEQSEEYYKQTIELARSMNMKFLLADCYQGIADLHIRNQSWDAAQTSLQNAIDLCTTYSMDEQKIICQRLLSDLLNQFQNTK